MSTDANLALALGALLKADEADEPFDNQLLATALGWDLTETAECLATLKERSMVWGRRDGRIPAPWFCELEVTVQGRRFLRAVP